MMFPAGQRAHIGVGDLPRRRSSGIDDVEEPRGDPRAALVASRAG